jgi:hypothetical protein
MLVTLSDHRQGDSGDYFRALQKAKTVDFIVPTVLISRRDRGYWLSREKTVSIHIGECFETDRFADVHVVDARRGDVSRPSSKGLDR